ncbi:tyrosine-type recombinase/integrase [Kangiella sp. TOML190]|uniref:tyrosine-type recombinase/integrase n=1 Tax=Kangiella sp. TOML190 TaxID=2931351 RepID=UPI00203B7B19|nr:tyrosine-type recombinase/integrase [Kangiella sp. TOML190]
MTNLQRIKTLAELVPHHIEDVLAKGLSDQTAYTKERALNLFINWCSSQNISVIGDLSIEVLENFRKHLYRYRKPDGKPLQLSTQRLRLMAVTGFLKFLDHYELMDSTFYKKFTLPKVPQKFPKDIPDFEEIELIFKQTETAGAMMLRDRAYLEFLYGTGMRRCEVARVQVNHLDFKNNLVIIRKGKGSLDRVAPLAERVKFWLKKYLKELRPKLANIDSGDALLLGHNGKPLKLSALTELASYYVARSGIGKQGACHIFRHATATHMVRGGADTRFVQELLGHQDMKSTQIYTHLTAKDLSKAYNQYHPAANSAPRQGL